MHVQKQTVFPMYMLNCFTKEANIAEMTVLLPSVLKEGDLS